MNRRALPSIVAAALLAVALGVGVASRAQEQAPLPALVGRVVRISDGDTLTLLVNRQEIRVRLHGIDAPEAGQPFGTVARKALADAVFGKTVQVENRGQDRYRRTLGVVRLDGVDVNGGLVKDGMAWAYVKYSRAYVAQEKDAREARRGLWVDAAPMPPWEWRDARR